MKTFAAKVRYFKLFVDLTQKYFTFKKTADYQAWHLIFA